ncbi:hypothetical protein NHP190012_17100 (plasmid) [Helicobacter sp. NHP19-012]|uniref:TRL-like family protein n=1 Tax=Helicobacter gastrofelis TaxID=2849642 RepID=A0ABM7SPS0_9HELI|nr:TRL-like family protein [Helicobacter sp. NHP19-012]BCZ20068.1 hypothetical protein NHP190012_17100 [Helicobacter sp. NHP19-012]
MTFFIFDTRVSNENSLSLSLSLSFVLLIGACTSPAGLLFNGSELPVSGKSAKYSKEGHATCMSFLWLIAGGNCSVKKAAEKGSITDIKMVDRKVITFPLGIMGIYTTIVRGD